MAPVASPQPCGVEALTCAFNAMSFKLPFPSLTKLRISIMDIDSETLVKTFGKLPLLKWACVPSSSRSSFEALVYNVSFPNLQRIDLSPHWHSSAESISVDMLLDCLMERCERNAEIQMLCLVICFFNDIKRLKEIVVNVAYCNNAKFPSKLC